MFILFVFSLALLAPLANLTSAEEAFKITPDVVYGHKAGMALTYDLIQHKEENNSAAVVFIMSGGWFSGWMSPERIVADDCPKSFAHFRNMVEAGYSLIVVRHGSAPQFKVPDAVRDVRRAIRHIRSQASTFGIDPDRIGVTGGSAGGHLSLMLGTTADDGRAIARDQVGKTASRVAAVVAYFPPVDLRAIVGPSKRFPALDFKESKAPDVSPLLHVTSDDAPTLLIHGDKDVLVKLDHSRRIFKALRESDVESQLIVIEGAGHGFEREDARRASEALVQWFDKHLLGKVADVESPSSDSQVEEADAVPAASGT